MIEIDMTRNGVLMSSFFYIIFDYIPLLINCSSNHDVEVLENTVKVIQETSCVVFPPDICDFK